MKAICFLFAVILYGGSGHAQNTLLDSLKLRVDNASSETQRIDRQITYIHSLSRVDLDSGLALARELAAEAHATGYRFGEVGALNEAGTAAMQAGKFDVAKQILDSAFTVLSEDVDSMQWSMLNSGYGMMYGMQGRYDSSISHYLRAMRFYERADTSGLQLGRVYGNIAIGYRLTSNYPQALFYQQKSLDLAEKFNNLTSQAFTTLNMALTYDAMDDLERERTMLEKALALAQKAQVPIVEVYAYTNLASLATRLENWGEAHSYGIKAAELAEQLGDKPIEAASYSKAATALANLGQFDEAKDLIHKATPDAEASGQPIVVCQLNVAMGHTLMLEGKYEQAIPYLEDCADTFAGTDEYDRSVAELFQDLSTSYENTGAYRQALENYKKYAAVNDSIRAREKIQKATELNMNYEFEKKRAKAEAAQAVKDAESKRARNRQYFMMALLGLTLLAVAVIALMQYRSKRGKQKANLLLKSEKHKVERTLAELRDTQAQLIQSEKMASLGELTAGIAHEIQNPLNFVNNFSEVSVELLDEMKSEIKDDNGEVAGEIADDVIKNLVKINHHGKRAEGIVKAMLEHSRTNTGSVEPTDLNKLCDEYLRLAYHGLRAKDKSFNAGLVTRFDPAMEKISVVPQDIGRVLLNLITNAFHACLERRAALVESDHSRAEAYEPKVTVTTKMGEAAVEVSVADNGAGIPDDVRDKIFQPFFTTKATGQGTGLGLSISYDIVKAHGGELEVKSLPSDGTCFTIVLPRLKQR